MCQPMITQVTACFFASQAFLTNAKGYPCLSKRHQRFLKPDGISIPSSYWTFSYTYIYLIPNVKNMLNNIICLN
jgi:hypothetical protein